MKNKEIFKKKKMKHSITFIYDKDCYLCSNFQQYIALKKICDIHFLDMNQKESKSKLLELKSQGYDIQRGMILEIDGMIYQWKQALEQLEKLLDKKNILDRLVSRCMQNEIVLKFWYPIASAARKVLLFLRKFGI